LGGEKGEKSERSPWERKKGKTNWGPREKPVKKKKEKAGALCGKGTALLQHVKGGGVVRALARKEKTQTEKRQ